MTDNEIIKAFEICYLDSEEECVNCPYLDKEGFCKDVPDSALLHDVLDLINRQKAEIERLNAMRREMCIGMKVLKRKVIKEFAENLKEIAEFLKDDDDYIGYAECVRTCHIDNLVKEMTEQRKEDERK